LSNEYKIAETGSFRKKIQGMEYRKVYNKIKLLIYPQLKSNPHFSPQIKILKGDFKNIYRYRIADYRLFYVIDDEKKVVVILGFHHRKDAYK
jgi:mRNA interferase RelE/StbE